MAYIVGSVPYLNARPLVHGLQADVTVVYHVPSQLPKLLEDERADAVLVSSIEAIRRPGMRVAAGVSISSIGEVMSVRLFSKVPPSEIRTLALDRSSMTSNALAQMVLAERFGARPEAHPEQPDLTAMLEKYDAAVMIGDNGMRAEGAELHVLDLGLQWHEMTGLPFVWALWVGGGRLTPELAGRLTQARAEGARRVDEIVSDEVRTGRWHPSICGRYLKEVMNYELSVRHLEGLREFGRRLVAYRLLAKACEPEIVEARSTAGMAAGDL